MLFRSQAAVFSIVDDAVDFADDSGGGPEENFMLENSSPNDLMDLRGYDGARPSSSRVVHVP